MKLLCPECGSRHVKHEFKEKICEECGFIIEENMFVGS